MKSRITFFIMLMFAGILSTQAQQGYQKRTVEERVQQTLARVNDSLKLDKVQHLNIDSVLTEFYKGQDKLREGLTPGIRPERTDIDKLISFRDARLKMILTGQQYNKFKEMEAAMRQRQRPPGQ